jgi:hypothetical protein
MDTSSVAQLQHLEGPFEMFNKRCIESKVDMRWDYSLLGPSTNCLYTRGVRGTRGPLLEANPKPVKLL